MNLPWSRYRARAQRLLTITSLFCGLIGGTSSAAAQALPRPDHGAQPAVAGVSPVAEPPRQAPLYFALAPTPPAVARKLNRGMWVWNAPQVYATPGAAGALLRGAAAAKVTDLYMYVGERDYLTQQANLANFNKQASQAGVRVWALDGARTYFGDAEGPASFFAGINNLIAFNKKVGAKQRFCGFQADNEPNDAAGYKTFHDGLTDSALSAAPGSGVWQQSQTADRELLMRDWLAMHQTASERLHGANLLFGAVMPSWTMDYFGAPIEVAYPTAASPRRGVTEQMMALVDEYVIMTYNTNVDNALNRAVAQVQFASNLPQAKRPKVYASVETVKDVGVNISYGDTPGKDSRKLVLQDMEKISRALAGYPAFAGMAIEAWDGWQALRP